MPIIIIKESNLFVFFIKKYVKPIDKRELIFYYIYNHTKTTKLLKIIFNFISGDYILDGVTYVRFMSGIYK